MPPLGPAFQPGGGGGYRPSPLLQPRPPAPPPGPGQLGPAFQPGAGGYTPSPLLRPPVTPPPAAAVASPAVLGPAFQPGAAGYAPSPLLQGPGGGAQLLGAAAALGQLTAAVTAATAAVAAGHQSPHGRGGVVAKTVVRSAVAARVGGAKAGGMMAMATVIGELLRKAAKEGTYVGNVLQNASLTNAQKGEEIASNYSPVVAELIKFRDMLSLTTETLRQNNLEFELRARSAQVEAQQRPEIYDARRNIASARSQEVATAAIGRDRLRVFDRSTYAGEIAAAEQNRRLPAQDAVTLARRQEMAAAADVATAQAGIKDIDREIRNQRTTLQSAQNAVKRINREESGGLSGIPGQFSKQGFGAILNPFGRDKAGKDTALREAQEANNRLIAMEEERRRRIGQLDQASVNLEQQRSAVRKANNQLLAAEIANLEAKEQRIAGNAVRLGGMNATDRAVGLSAAKFIQQNGLQAATPEILSAARSFAPEFVRKQAERFGENTNEYQEARRAGIDDFQDKERLADVRADLDGKLKQEFRINLDIDEQKLTRGVTTAFESTFQALIDTLAKLKKGLETQIRTGQQIRINSPGG